MSSSLQAGDASASSVPAFHVAIDFSARSVAISGELDFETASHLLGAIEPLLSDPIGDVEVDMALVTFFDSSGLHALECIEDSLSPKGYRLIVVNPSAGVRRVFMAAGSSSLLVVP